MISWIQTTFEKHTKFFMAFLLLVITIPFVFTIGAAPGIGKGDGRAQQREFFGYNLSSQGDTRRLTFDARISILLQAGYMMDLDGRQLQDYAFQRAASLSLADRYHLPRPTAAQRQTFLTSLRIFQSQQGQFDATAYNRFRDQLKTSTADFTEADVARVVEDECRIQRIGELLAGPGYVAPIEVANQLSLASTQWTLKVAELDLGTYAPSIRPTDEILTKHLEDNAAKFEVPDRVNIDYVTFKAADFAGAETFTDDEVVAYFEANKERFATPSTEAGKPATPAVLAVVRPQVEAALRTAAANRNAAKAASDFAFEIFDQKISKDSPAIDALVAKFHGHRATAPLFTRGAPPAGLPWTRQLVDEAFRLEATRFYSDALPLGDDQLVLLWRETLPKFTPSLVEARDQVLADFTDSEKSRALLQNAPEWKSALESKLAAGVQLDAALASIAGAPKAEVKSYGPFTRRQPPEGLSRTVSDGLERINAGGLSDLLRDANKAYFVQVIERKSPVIDRNSPEYIQIGNAVAANSANAARSSALSELVEAELQRSAPPAQ
ncbi:MAG: peptidyl-prolyl cis-trans isomerase [Opitutaceae bacterium]|nr:peptidyl-prolyl cis-trans isomerase [Opitutaceae bacterium]